MVCLFYEASQKNLSHLFAVKTLEILFFHHFLFQIEKIEYLMEFGMYTLH